MTSAQIKNSFTHLGEIDSSVSPSSLVLKLSATQDSLRYFVLSQTHQQVIFFGDYTLHHISNAADLAAGIQKVFEKDEILQLPFAKVLIGLDDRYDLVPHELTGILSVNGKMITPCLETDLVFESENQVLQVFRKVFANPKYLHLNSSFLHALQPYAEDNAESLFLNVGKRHVDVICFRNKALQLMNRYEYRTGNDFIYFVLLCCDELKINRESVDAVLLGELDIQSKIYELCYRYFRNIRFIQKPAEIHFSKAFEIYPKHLHFNLYNLQA
jgi:hypothetical protein